MPTDSNPPWIGGAYPQHRILVLGESNWGVDLDDADYVAHWIEHPNFLKRSDCALCISCGRARHPGEKDYERDALFDHLTRMMNGGRDTTDASRREAWSRIAFTNFILRSLRDRSASARPADTDWREAEVAFPTRLGALAPRACLVLDNASGALMKMAGPLLKAAGVKAVRLAHPTMHPAPTIQVRAAAWLEVCAATS